MHQIRFSLAYNTVTDVITLVVWSEDSNGAIENASSCSVTIYNHDGTTALANASWTTAPTENSDYTWYMTKSSGSGSLSAGKAYYVGVTLNVSGSFTRYFGFATTT
jgi:hypothetical protein